ncbi:MAG: GLPGLI family protein [Saprospiraceae bacterium]|nr:GLPGLI family protein [Saprospiraceae bacterium]
MKKTLSFALSFLFFSITSLKSQADSTNTQSDSKPMGAVTYLHTVELSADKDRNGLATLFFNNARSAYIHHGVPMESLNKQIDEYNSVHISGDSEGFPIYKLHKEKKMWSKIPCYLSKQHCIVEDTLGDIAWVISPTERKTFGPYQCHKALGKFGGREYEAWFAIDIPANTGPYKLGGLPGLILEARTLDDQVKFTFVKIELSTTIASTIEMPSGNNTGMSYAEFIKARNEYCKNLEKEFRSKGNDVSITPDKNTIELVETGN